MSTRTHYSPEHSQITLGIVTHNSAGHIVACLNSILEFMADAQPTIVIIDNASTDNTVGTIKNAAKNFPFPVELIQQPENYGFAWAVNRICDLAQTHWICLLNPDARLKSNVYQYAREIERRIPNCGPIGGMFVDPEGNPQECGGAFPTPMMAIWDWCGLRKIIPRRNWSTTLKYKFSSEAIPQKMDYPTGAFWLFRREVYQRVGKFDERFFLYFEETDFAKRALKQGWPAYVHPRIIIEHIKGASFQATQSSAVGDPLAIYFESLFKYLFKHFNKPCVIFTAAAIRNFLNLRKFIYKNEKSAKVLDAFTEGSSRALGYEELNHRQEK